MQVSLTREHGFCIGVRKAVELAQRAAAEVQGTDRTVWTLGPLIHNRRVVRALEALGVRTAPGVDAVPSGDILILPSHGATPELIAQAEARGLELWDATCPLVRKVQESARRLAGEGASVVLVGQASHTEVKSVVGWAGTDVVVVGSAAEAAALPPLPEPVVVIAQTTQRPDQVDGVVQALRRKQADVRVEPTLCPVTSDRQEEVRRMAASLDVLIVVGGRESANTRKLAEIGREMSVRVHHVEAGYEVEPSWFRPGDRVGITAGTSTPDWITEEVVARMNEIDPNAKAQDHAEETVSPETGPEVESAAQAEVDAVESSLANPPTIGDRVTGTVVKVGEEEILVDIGYKSEAVLPVAELGRGATDPLKEGEVIEAAIVKTDDEGRPVLSRKKIAEAEAWDRLQAALDQNLTIEAPVTAKVKGGLVADVGTRGFIPASQVGLEFIQDLEPYVGRTLRVKVIELDRAERRVILSEKKVLEEERAEQRQGAVASLKEGAVVPGEVKRVTDYGAFVDIGGVDGLLHVSEMSWKRVASPRDVVKEGDRIDVRILKIDDERGRISLGLKQVGPDPWQETVKRFPAGSVVDGKVVSVADFGVFVRLDEGVEGLVHVSQLADRRVGHPSEVAKVGDTLRVKVLKVNPAERRISLSAREAEAEMDRKQMKQFLKRANEEAVVTIGDMVGDLLQGARLGEAKDDEPAQK